MCLGMDLVDQGMFLVMARLLWAFDFNRAIDEVTGQEIVPDMDDVCTGLFTLPNPFKADIVPRDALRAQKIQQGWTRASEELLDENNQWKEIPVKAPRRD
jgi:hypothetical protein